MPNHTRCGNVIATLTKSLEITLGNDDGGHSVGSSSYSKDDVNDSDESLKVFIF